VSDLAIPENEKIYRSFYAENFGSMGLGAALVAEIQERGKACRNKMCAEVF